MYGEQKYSRDNWRHVAQDRYVKAAFRHLVDYASGKMFDEESKQSPLAHAVCCMLFILALEREHADQ